MPNGDEARNPSQPQFAYQTMPWAGAQIENSHTEALWAFGEFCLFTMMWNIYDLERGLVGRCPNCYANDRGAKAFGQTGDPKGCGQCFGTTFEGGFRAQIVRPTIIVHTSPELEEGIRGQTTVDQVNLETTTDFTLHHGDYMMRVSGMWYQCAEKQTDSVHDGFHVEEDQSPYVSNVAQAALEDPTSIAYTIPLLVGGGSETPVSLLDRSNFGVRTAVPADVLRPNGYL